jgi:hypothetical protein
MTVNNTKRKRLLEWFPRAKGNLTSLAITSPIDFGYNCVAWVLDRTDRWWQPGGGPYYFWPAAVPPDSSIQTYVDMFASQGFEFCATGHHEAGYAKIVLYVNDNNQFLHVAKQLPSGKWSSKCGGESDITHSSPELLEGNTYGQVWKYMRRPAE